MLSYARHQEGGFFMFKIGLLLGASNLTVFLMSTERGPFFIGGQDG